MQVLRPLPEIQDRAELVRAGAFTIPTSQPESDGTLEWNSTTIVVVEIEAGGERGCGYTYTSPGAAALVRQQLEAILGAHAPMDIGAIWRAARGRLRNLGPAGITATAVAALDIALWDLKARQLGIPLTALIGRHRDRVPVYGSGGFTSYSDRMLSSQFEDWSSQGISRFKMKVGREPDRDLARVQTARRTIGPEAELFVDANSAYTRAQAASFAEIFSDLCRVTWLEEPLDPEDLEGLRFLRERVPTGVEIAEGEYIYELDYLRRLLTADGADVVMPDATRCGGVTGFLRAAALCEAWHKPMSCHCAPALHAVLGCSVASVRHIEYFADHVRIEKMLFDGGPRLVDGCLEPDHSRPGFGWEFKWADAEPYAA